MTRVGPEEAIERVLAAYRFYGWSLPEGEWGSVNRVREPLHQALQVGNRGKLYSLLSGCLSGDLIAGVVTVGDVAELENLQRDVQYWSHLTDGADLQILRAPEIGRPYVTKVDGVPIMFDTPRHDYHAQKVMSLGPERVLEIGGGYGGFVMQLRRRGYTGRVYILDLPETLYLSFPVLASQTDDVAWVHEDPAAATVLVPVSRSTSIPPVDVVYSANALGEMPLEVVHGYMRLIERLAPRWFYHQGMHKGPLITYVQEFPEVPVSEFGLTGYREVYRALAIWANSQSRYWEFLLERAA